MLSSSQYNFKNCLVQGTCLSEDIDMELNRFMEEKEKGRKNSSYGIAMGIRAKRKI